MMAGRLGWRWTVGALALTTAMACGEDSVGVAEPEMLITPLEVDFGNIQVGRDYRFEVLIENTGSGSLEISDIAPTPDTADIFTWTIADDDRRIPPSGVSSLMITAKAIREGTFEGALVVNAERVDAQTISLRAIGANTTLALTPEALDFGDVLIGSNKTLEVEILNESPNQASITLDTARSGGERAQPCAGDVAATFCYEFTRKRPVDGKFTLDAGESTTVRVTYRPSGTFLERSTMHFLPCEGSDCAVPLRMSGRGVEKAFSCDYETMDFGVTPPGRKKPMQLTCTNVAAEDLTVETWSITANNPDADVAFTTTEPPVRRTLSEGQSMSLEVNFIPPALGEHGATLVLETDDKDPSKKRTFVALRGIGGGPQIEVRPRQLNFGLVSTIAPARRSIIVQNLGSSPLEISDITMDRLETGAFRLNGSQTVVIDPGSLHTFTVEFQPTLEGDVISDMVIHSNDPLDKEVEVTLLGSGISLPPCDFAVTPSQLNFGVVERARVASRAFLIENRGDADCLVTGARMEPGSAPEFSLPDGDVNSLIIPPGSATSVRIEYAPTESVAHAGQVEFSISSDISPFNLVPVAGTGADTALLISPNDIDFGVIGVGCATRARQVTIYNTGATPTTLSAVQLVPVDAPFSIRGLPDADDDGNILLAAGESIDFTVSFRAPELASYAAAIEIVTDFGGVPSTYYVNLQGRGDVDALQRDEFVQLPKPDVDILFVVDDSCSMGDEQAALGRNFEAFIQFANAESLNYQIGVVTTDPRADRIGRLVSHTPGALQPSQAGPPETRLVTPHTTPSPEEAFARNVNVGTLGSGSERGLDAAHAALTAPVLFGRNAGLLRPNAVLSVIFISDEPEQSSRSTDFFIDFFKNIKGPRNTDLFSASAITGGENGCNGQGGSASGETRFTATAKATGGVTQSICASDWAQALQELSVTAFGFRSQFLLTNRPVVQTLEVYIDGQLIPPTSNEGTVNWRYDPAAAAVKFEPVAVPEPGAEIRVEYTAECI